MVEPNSSAQSLLKLFVNHSTGSILQLASLCIILDIAAMHGFGQELQSCLLCALA